jgi:hypothetical protein
LFDGHLRQIDRLNPPPPNAVALNNAFQGGHWRELGRELATLDPAARWCGAEINTLAHGSLRNTGWPCLALSPCLGRRFPVKTWATDSTIKGGMVSKDSMAALDNLRILEVRGQAVVLDSDLAALYGVETKVFSQAIRRNARRFPDDFLFRVTSEEWASLRSQFVTLKTTGRGEHRKYLPLVFTEHGAIMARCCHECLRRARIRAPAQRIARQYDLGETSHPYREDPDHARRDLARHLRKDPAVALPPPEKPKRQIGFRAEPE